MLSKTFGSKGQIFDIDLFPSPAGKKYPLILIVHGNAGLTPPFGDQIRGFAEGLSNLGYFTAVPKYYTDDIPHLLDQTPHEQTLSDSVAELVKQPEVDPKRIGLIGFSLGAATAMSYIASKPPGTMSVFADFFGFLTPSIRAGLSNFPPTIIFHSRHDGIVPVQNSIELDNQLPATIPHELITYDEVWERTLNHSFLPGGHADVNSRKKATNWFINFLPPVGI